MQRASQNGHSKSTQCVLVCIEMFILASPFVFLFQMSFLEALASLLVSFSVTHSLTFLPEQRSQESKQFLPPKEHQRPMSSIQSISAGCKQLSPCLSGVSRPAANVYRLTARWSPITLCIIHCIVIV